MPALAAVLLCLGLTGYVVLAGAEPDVATLQARAKGALASGKFSAAALHQQHVMAIEPNNPAHAYGLAMTLEKLGKRLDAMSVLGTIAPVAGGGYAPAHLKLAEWTIESSAAGWKLTAVAIDQAIQHAEAAKADPALRLQAETFIDILNGMRTP